jgi:putative aldouronate transport system permease protein
MTAIKESKSDRIFNIINNFIVVFALLIVLYPLIYVLSASISDPDQVNLGNVWLLPKGLQFDGYRRVFQDREIWIGYKNTIFYTLVGTLVNLFFTLTAAYPLSRKDFYGRNVFTVLFTFTMFFSGGLIPTYLIVKDFGLMNSMWALIIPGAASMYYIIIVRTFFQSTIPAELHEAASMDGCSNIRLFVSIIIPLSTPVIAVMSLFYGVAHWNSYFSALIYLSDSRKYPLQLILREILVMNQMSVQMMETGDQADTLEKQARIAELIKYAVIIVSSIPVLAIYPFLQRYFVKGMLVGAIKG